MFPNLKQSGKCDDLITSLYFAKNSTLSVKIFTGTSVSCTALLGFNFLISLRTVFLSTGEK